MVKDIGQISEHIPTEVTHSSVCDSESAHHCIY